MITELDKASFGTGLIMNLGKTKIMGNRKMENRLVIRNEELWAVGSFVNGYNSDPRKEKSNCRNLCYENAGTKYLCFEI